MVRIEDGEILAMLALFSANFEEFAIRGSFPKATVQFIPLIFKQNLLVYIESHCLAD